MNTLYQHLAGESLSDALQRIEAGIKARPADADLRAAFVQFLTLSGNWTRALTQLKSWLALKPQAKPTVTLLEQSIEGELQRARVTARQRRHALRRHGAEGLAQRAKRKPAAVAESRDVCNGWST